MGNLLIPEKQNEKELTVSIASLEIHGFPSFFVKSDWHLRTYMLSLKNNGVCSSLVVIHGISRKKYTSGAFSCTHVWPTLAQAFTICNKKNSNFKMVNRSAKRPVFCPPSSIQCCIYNLIAIYRCEFVLPSRTSLFYSILDR